LGDALTAVSELNGQVMDALTLSAQSARAFPLDSKLRRRFAALSASHRQGAARCGVLLADAGFADPKRWRSLVVRGEFDDSTGETEWLPADEAVVLASAVLLVAWHIVHVRPSIAGFLLGMPDATMSSFRNLGIAELTRVARRHPQWVQPRWPDRPDLWQNILAAHAGSPAHDPAELVLRCLKASAIVSSRLMLSAESTD
jgi:hypothetical protein